MTCFSLLYCVMKNVMRRVGGPTSSSEKGTKMVHTYLINHREYHSSVNRVPLGAPLTVDLTPGMIHLYTYLLTHSPQICGREKKINGTYLPGEPSGVPLFSEPSAPESTPDCGFNPWHDPSVYLLTHSLTSDMWTGKKNKRYILTW